MTREELTHLEWKHNVLNAGVVHEPTTTFATGDTSQASTDWAIEYYNQKQWWEL